MYGCCLTPTSYDLIHLVLFVSRINSPTLKISHQVATKLTTSYLQSKSSFIYFGRLLPHYYYYYFCNSVYTSITMFNVRSSPAHVSSTPISQSLPLPLFNIYHFHHYMSLPLPLVYVSTTLTNICLYHSHQYMSLPLPPIYVSTTLTNICLYHSHQYMSLPLSPIYVSTIPSSICLYHSQ